MKIFEFQFVFDGSFSQIKLKSEVTLGADEIHVFISANIETTDVKKNSEHHVCSSLCSRPNNTDLLATCTDWLLSCLFLLLD